MTNDEKGWVVMQLVPRAKFSGCWYDNSIVWKDERPFPSEAEIDAKYNELETEKGRTELQKQARDNYEANLAAGYEDTDGKKYRCDKEGIIDLALAHTLLVLNPYDPVHMLTLDDQPVSKDPASFTELASRIGQYHYALRRTYWEQLALIG